MKPLAKIAFLLLALSTSACISIYVNGKPEMTCRDTSCSWNDKKSRCECTTTAYTGFWSFIADLALFNIEHAPPNVDGQIK